MTAAVESGIVQELLSRADLTRVLEVGTGAGRLSRSICSLARASVGVDLDRKSLGVAAKACSGLPSMELVQSDAMCLPFADGTFTAAVMVRLLHWFPEPSIVLNELRRVIVPGGHLILSVNSRPSLDTLSLDVWSHLRRRSAQPSITFSRASFVTIRCTENRGYIGSRPWIRSLIKRCGFVELAVRGSGFERLPIMRALPPQVCVRLSPLVGGRAWAPSDFFLLRAGAEKSESASVAGVDILDRCLGT